MALFGKKNVSEVTFNIDGMHCNMCAANLQRGLSETDGVKKASVSFDTKKAEISYDPGKTSPEKLAQAVSEIGYSVVP
jgi:copper chaperone CopZ